MANYFLYKDKQFTVGSTIVVTQKIKEGDKTRQQAFEGMLIRVKGHQGGKTITVRKIASAQVGVERIWPLNSPNIVDIKIKKAGQARRAKLYYLRDRIGKKAVKISVKTPKKVKIAKK